MKFGYSLLLGEYFPSENLEHRDCEEFQVVCPACKEPIFKVAGHRAQKKISYFSHYKKDKSYSADCEFRVNSITSKSIKNKNSESRKQRLDYFLAKLRNIIIDNEYPSDPRQAKNRKYLFKLMKRSKGLVFLRKMMYENCQENMGKSLNENDFYGMLDEYIDDIKQVSGSFFDTSFSLSIQKRITRDIWLHLLSHNAEKNWMFLFNHAYSHAMIRISLAKKERNLHEWETYLYNCMDQLLIANKSKAVEIFNNLASYPIGPPFAIEVNELFGKMASEINHEMLGCLLRLPYFEYLNKTYQKQLKKEVKTVA